MCDLQLEAIFTTFKRINNHSGASTILQTSTESKRARIAYNEPCSSHHVRVVRHVTIQLNRTRKFIVTITPSGLSVIMPHGLSRLSSQTIATNEIVQGPLHQQFFNSTAAQTETNGHFSHGEIYKHHSRLSNKKIPNTACTELWGATKLTEKSCTFFPSMLEPTEEVSAVHYEPIIDRKTQIVCNT